MHKRGCPFADAAPLQLKVRVGQREQSRSMCGSDVRTASHGFSCWSARQCRKQGWGWGAGAGLYVCGDVHESVLCTSCAMFEARGLAFPDGLHRCQCCRTVGGGGLFYILYQGQK
ncbi:unnamed protein product [Nyctereutes procyonoides]|uniref:(raccoon dog) hypothetical protein n=1 Tax=Nyctereutes procyonoides TaxID=34880 RepID=A0A811YQ21_NYCPR|nr:unnamed protein product [Nyctereutes procyonoides]